MKMNESIVLEGEVKQHAKISKFAGGKKGLKRPVTESLLKKREEQWAKFKEFLVENVGHSLIEHESSECAADARGKMEKIDIVIDGANVGYFKNVFTDSPQAVDYEQIDSVVNHFRNKKMRVLLFL